MCPFNLNYVNRKKTSTGLPLTIGIYCKLCAHMTKDQFATPTPLNGYIWLNKLYSKNTM